LRKERFPFRRRSKLMARGDDPYKIVQTVGNNTYKIGLSGEMNISPHSMLETSLPTLGIKMRDIRI